MRGQFVLLLSSFLLSMMSGAASRKSGCACQTQTNPPSCQCNCLPGGGSGVPGDPCPTSSILSCGYNYALTDTVPLTSYTLAERVLFSPFYLQLFGNKSDMVNVVGSCDTYYPLLNNSEYLLLRTLTFSNGSTTTDKFFISDLTPGCVRLTGSISNQGPSSIVMNDCVYKLACSPAKSVVYGLVRRHLFQTGNSINGILVPLAFSVIPRPPQSCINEILAFYQSLGFNDIIQPSYSNYKCVTQLNGIKCINSQYVPKQNSISIPNPYS